MTLVPVPGLKLAHSFLDDLFALGATVAGLAFGHTLLVTVLVAIYLLVGLVTAPLLTRLTWIHMRIGWSLLVKWAAKMGEPHVPRRMPSWVTRWLEENGLSRPCCPRTCTARPRAGVAPAT
jgi:hypothetical protein